MHPAAAAFVAEHGAPGQLAALDVGGRDVNGSARAAFPGAQWTVVDLREADGVDLVADVSDPGFCDDHPELVGAFDVVLCTEVLEHVAAWEMLVANAARCVGPGGRLVVTCAGPGRQPHSGISDSPDLAPGEHYANVSTGDLAAAITAGGLLLCVLRQAGSDTQAIAQAPAG